MTKLTDPSSEVFSAALVCAGELARVDDVAVAVQMPKLVGLILDVLQDQSSLKRKEEAVKVLGQLAQQTGKVIGLCVFLIVVFSLFLICIRLLEPFPFSISLRSAANKCIDFLLLVKSLLTVSGSMRKGGTKHSLLPRSLLWH